MHGGVFAHHTPLLHKTSVQHLPLLANAYAQLTFPQSFSVLLWHVDWYPLDKNPGVRPITIGELPRRIISKAVLSIIGQDIADATCPLQLCAGLVGGCEAAIHAIQKLFSNTSTEGILFNNVLNRQAALHNISVLCPPFFQILQNTYRTLI